VFAALLAALRGRRSAAIVILTVAYLAMVAPVGGLVQVGAQFAADRYAYQPGWVLTLTIAAMLWSVVGRLNAFRGGRTLCAGAAFTLVATLAVLSIVQQRFWHDGETLWRRELAIYPETCQAHFNLGQYYMKKSAGPASDANAETHLRRAIALLPT